MTNQDAGSRTPLDTLLMPIVRLARQEIAGAMLLLLCTAAALVIANSPTGHIYEARWDTVVTISFGQMSLSESRHQWVNDGLMAIFFFLVGLEIKREILMGELSSLRQAAFPFVAALGGSVVPALIYIGLNHGKEGASGWGIPMATDIAFALGALALLGSRIPAPLKIFVAALAIADDIVAVGVIAFFYTAEISFVHLGLGLAGIAVSAVANWAGVRKPIIYAFLFAFVWVAMLKSGVHATIAGVLMAFTIPAKTYIDRPRFLQRCGALLRRLEQAAAGSGEEHEVVHSLEAQCELMQSPLHRIEHKLQPWVTFMVMPLFALANAGVNVVGGSLSRFWNTCTLGIFLGLVLGKPVGIFLLSWVSTKWGMASSPAGVSWRQIFGASWLCGIGFTMSLFIATLGLAEESLQDSARFAILAASLASGVAGSLVLLKAKPQEG
jgi:NhaA family Na+:H+ antiporter